MYLLVVGVLLFVCVGGGVRVALCLSRYSYFFFSSLFKSKNSKTIVEGRWRGSLSRSSLPEHVSPRPSTHTHTPPRLLLRLPRTSRTGSILHFSFVAVLFLLRAHSFSPSLSSYALKSFFTVLPTFFLCLSNSLL